MFGVAGLRARLAAPRSDRALHRLASAVDYTVWSLLWVAAHVAGGAGLGALLGLAGRLLGDDGRRAGAALLAALAVVLALRGLGVVRLRTPEIPRQVSRDWMQRLPWSLTAVGYGLQLGCGIATRIRAASLYVALGCALLSGSAASGAALLGLFGLARAVLPVTVGPNVASPERAFAFTVAFDRHEERVRRLEGVLLGASAVVLALAALAPR